MNVEIFKVCNLWSSVKLVNLVGEVTYVPCSDKLTVLPTYQLVCSIFIDRRVRIEKSTLILTIRDVDSHIMLPYSLSVGWYLVPVRNCFEFVQQEMKNLADGNKFSFFLQVFNFRNASIYSFNPMFKALCQLNGIFDVQGSLLT